MSRVVLRASLLLLTIALAVWLSDAAAIAQQPRQPEQQGEFVPLSEAGPQEQLPAAPLLIGAYAFVWVGVLAYVWSMARRIRKVEDELRALERGSR
jgi:CcmD family protein